MREYMQNGPGKTDERRFRDEVTNVGDITEVAVRTSISKAKEFLQNINDVDGTFAEHQSDCNEIVNRIKQHTKRAKKGKQQPGTNTALKSLVDNLRKKHESMETAWSKIIQCAIDRENPTVFHEISVRVWATSDSVNAAIAEAKRAINSQETHGGPQRGKTHAPAVKEGKEDVRAYTKTAIKIDNGIVEQSAEKTTEAIEQNESAKTATHKNVTNEVLKRAAKKHMARRVIRLSGIPTGLKPMARKSGRLRKNNRTKGPEYR